jgi:molecular chaperone DnaJ
MKKCGTCDGKGKIQETKTSIFGAFSTVTTCNTCSGKGEVPSDPCNECHGEGTVKGDKDIRIVIPPGIEDGEMIRVPGAGEALKNGATGDMYVKVHVRQHKAFEKEGYDLITELPIRITDALLGANLKIETLEGPLEVTIPAGSRDGDEIKVKGRGVPASGAVAVCSVSSSCSMFPRRFQAEEP